jgi:hypothetical protein
LRTLLLTLLLLAPTAGDSYHTVPISEFPTRKWTHVCTVGYVGLRKKEADGDVHLRIDQTLPIRGAVMPRTGFIVAEVIPQLPLPTAFPFAEKVKVCGIRRFDDTHGWWEIHPVLALEEVK